MTIEEQQELQHLDACERQGMVLPGHHRGRLADLRRQEILETVQGMLPPVNPVEKGVEKR